MVIFIKKNWQHSDQSESNLIRTRKEARWPCKQTIVGCTLHALRKNRLMHPAQHYVGRNWPKVRHFAEGVCYVSRTSKMWRFATLITLCSIFSIKQSVAYNSFSLLPTSAYGKPVSASRWTSRFSVYIIRGGVSIDESLLAKNRRPRWIKDYRSVKLVYKETFSAHAWGLPVGRGCAWVVWKLVFRSFSKVIVIRKTIAFMYVWPIAAKQNFLRYKSIIFYT